MEIEIDGTRLRVAYEIRRARRTPLVVLHGFGSTKEDYSDLALYPPVADRTLLAFDAPGCGDTEFGDLSAVSIELMQRTTASMIEHFGLREYHLAGHSMGGLTALLHALERPRGLLSLISIEGNLAPEDCFFSAQIDQYPDRDPEQFLASLASRVRDWPAFSSGLYASRLPQQVRAGAVASIFRSMVTLSNERPLLRQFLRLQYPKMFVYGALNQSLSYLDTLRASDVQVVEIPLSGHFPMYANPPALWSALSRFVDHAETASA